jgi:hypothetical protein
MFFDSNLSEKISYKVINIITSLLQKYISDKELSFNLIINQLKSEFSIDTIMEYKKGLFLFDNKIDNHRKSFERNILDNK